MRILCVSGINITGYNAATATVFVALEDDPSRLNPIKLYHSEIGLLGNRSVKILDVELSEADGNETREIIVQMDGMIEKFKK